MSCWVLSVPWAQGWVSLRGADLGSCSLLPGADTWPELTELEGSLHAQAECVTYPTNKATCSRQASYKENLCSYRVPLAAVSVEND